MLTGALGRGTLTGLGRAPRWAWLGGLSGAFSVITATRRVAPRRAMVVIAAALLGQSMASLAIAHLGWLDVPRIPVNAWHSSA